MAERRKKPFWIKGTYFDYPTLFYIIFLTFFGLMMVYSSSVYISNRYYDNGYKYLTKQFGFAMVGFLIMFLVSRVRYQVFKKFIYLFIIALVLMLLYVLIWGKEVNGASRWISLGPISFQPSEIAKIVIPLYMAYACTDRTWFMYSLKGMAALFGPVLVIVGLIAIENLSTAIIVGAMAFGVWFMATTKHIYIIHMAVLGALALAALVLAEPYRIKRITNWGGKEDAALKAIIWLEQGGENQIQKCAASDMVLPLLKQVIYSAPDSETVHEACLMLDGILSNIPIYRFVNTGDLDSSKMLGDFLDSEVEKEVEI